MPRCRKYKYKKKRSNEPVVNIRKQTETPKRYCEDIRPVYRPEVGEGGEGLFLSEHGSIQQYVSPIEALRNWVQKQRYIPQDLSDEFLGLFLSAVGFDVELAEQKLQKYFFSRQEPSVLFRDRDPLSPENERIFKKLYVLPMSDTTEEGRKVILTGLVEPVVCYNPIDHAKILAMVLDLLIWERDFGFGDFIIVFDGRGFEFPQLLENKVPNPKPITSLLLDTIPGTLHAFYFLYPPTYATNIINNRHGIWITTVRTKEEMVKHLPADILPLEFGGSRGHLDDLIEQWMRHITQNREFFIQFEKRMTRYYQRRLCHEKEVAEGGENWVYKMKLVSEESEYKKEYYERMRNMEPLVHPAYGPDRLKNMPKPKPVKDRADRCRKLAKAEAEREAIFLPPKLYNGYAKAIRAAKLEAERTCSPVLHLHIYCRCKRPTSVVATE